MAWVQVLIFPYYTVNNDFITLINLVNTSDQPKALRVRFREAANGREVFAFNLYLDAKDAWVGALFKTDEDQGYLTQIISPDNSCTIPSMMSGLQFNKDHYTEELVDRFGVNDNRMHEGFIEVIEMGVLTGESANATVIDQEIGQANCQILQDAWDIESVNSYWLNDAYTDMLPPTGGILGNVTLIDVINGIAVSEPVTTLVDFSDDILHFNIDNSSPSLADGKTTSTVEVNGAIYNLEWETGIEAVTSVLMKSRVNNEYALDTEINAQTDWIITMPTKSFHTDPMFLSDESPIPPFIGTLAAPNYCEEFGYAIYDREETTPMGISIPPDPFPPARIPAIPLLCFATNDLTFFQTKNRNPPEQPEGIFFSKFHSGMYYQNGDISTNFPIPAPYENGWLYVIPSGEQTTLDLNITLYGLPVIGFAMQSYINANAMPGILANYAGSFRHKSKKNIHENNMSGTRDCARLINNWTPPNGKWVSNPSEDMVPPDGSGSIYGSVSLIDIGTGADITYDASAIIAFNVDIMHTIPGDLEPNLSSAGTSQTVIETADGYVQTTWDSPINAVTALFMQSKVENDFTVDPAINAQTEWVNYFPTKRYYVDSMFSGSEFALPPFKNSLAEQTGACDSHRFKAYSRDQMNNFRQTPIVIIDPPPPPSELTPFAENCWSVNVSVVGSGNIPRSIFDSSLLPNDLGKDGLYLPINEMPFISGWMEMDFVDETLDSNSLVGMGPNGEIHEIFGKPVIGFVAQKYVNGTLGAGNILANYAVVNMNKNNKKIEIQSLK